jgi:hypothetical protein
MGNVQCVKQASLYNCTFDKLVSGDPTVVEFLLTNEAGQDLEKAELENLIDLFQDKSRAAITLVGQDRGGQMVQSQKVPSVYELLHILESQPGKKRFLVRDTQAEPGKLRFGKSISLESLGFDERADSAIRSVARALDIKYHPNVLQPEAIFWDGTALNFITAKADATLAETGQAIRGQANRGALIAFLAYQLLDALAHVHADFKVLGDVSSKSILVFKLHGIPELRLVPGKHTVPASTTAEQDRLDSLMGMGVGRDRESEQSLSRPGTPSLRTKQPRVQIRDLDTIPCSFLEPGGNMMPTAAADIWAAGSALWEVITGVPYGCGCDLPNYGELLVKLETLSDQALPSTVWTEFRREMAKDLNLPGNVFDNLGSFAQPLMSLVRNMVRVDRDARSSAEELMQHRVFTSIKPHPQSSFSNIQELHAYTRRFVRMSPEARMALLQEASKDFGHQQHLVTLRPALKALRERLINGLLVEFSAKYGGIEPQLTQALHEAVRLTDKLLAADTDYNEYARLVLANFDFALNVGTALPFEVRQQLLERVLDYCAREFKLIIDPKTLAETQAAVLARHQGSMFLEQKEAREAGRGLAGQALIELVRQDKSTQVFADEQRKVQGLRVYVSDGHHAGLRGVINRMVTGPGGEGMLLIKLDNGQQVAISKNAVFYE